MWCADGACDPATDVQSELSCSSAQSGATAPSTGNHLKYYDCPEDAVDGFARLWQIGPEAIYTFTPQSSGSVTFRLSNLSNDQDLYVLADSCDPSSCIAASTFASIQDDEVTFTAEAGRTYFIVVEGYGGPGTYDLDFDIGTGGCPEDCANGHDDDDDALVDCADPDCFGEPECGCDNDGDGYNNPSCGGADCNDGDSAVHPGAAEQCNDIDDNCNGQVDEGLSTQTYYLDSDGDGVGGSTTVTDCAPPPHYVLTGGDCNDADPSVFPGASERCNGVDDNCDGQADEGLTIPLWYIDSDGDSWGTEPSQASCTPLPGRVSRGGDCADSNPAVYPGRTEVCNGIDDNCAGGVDEGLAVFAFYLDADGDQYGAGVPVSACRAPTGHVSASGDCADDDARRNPGAQEQCDGIDNNCNNRVDEDLPTQTYYLDSDGDSWGGSASTIACRAPAGHVLRSGDCRDDLPAIHPGATDGCDGIDNNCNGQIDEDGDLAVWFADIDGDGFGGEVSVQQCAAPAGYVGHSGDCNDVDATIHPNATEVCDGIDNDCDTLIDDADDSLDTSTGQAYFIDADGDGHGGSQVVIACVQPSDTSTLQDDCDDRSALRAPSLAEVCDGIDNNCDGVPDEGTSCFDDDGDGYTEDGGDCNDADSSVRPGRAEVCDGIDNNCNGVIDENTACSDDDGDGYTEDEGDCNDSDSAVSPGAVEIEGDGIDNDCDGSVDGGSYDPDGDGYSERGGDCIEGDALAHPGAIERPNGLDDDCDGIIDEGTTAYDDDGDGYTEDEGDCDDTNAAIYPGATELVDGRDNDCDGVVDNGSLQVDDDGDGLSEAQGDCDDTDPTVFPGATEQLNGVDDDCDGQIDEDFIDVDRDGLSAEQGDCDDNNGWVRPGIAEVCDGIDNDCDGIIDNDCGQQVVGVPQARCGCASGGTTWLGLWPLAGLALLVRRRKDALFAVAALGACNNDADFSTIDGRITVLPGVSDAGVVRVGDAVSVQLEVMHLSGPSVTVRAVDLFNLDGNMFTVFGELPVVSDGTSGLIDIAYTPSEPGYHRAAITVITSIGDAAEVLVRGRGVAPMGGLYPAVVEFGRVQVGDSAVAQVSVVNDGEQDWTVDDIDLSGPFSLLGELPVVVPAGHTATLSLSFAPTHNTPAVDIAGIEASGVALPNLTVRGNACEGGSPAAYDADNDGVSECAGDCDDTDPSVRPGAPERFDQRDNNCNGQIDEGTVGFDDDGDGASENEGDCNDDDYTVSPFASEIYGNGIDDDCDGVIDQGTLDADSDGVSPGGGDCDDSRASVRPGAPELVDGLDNNCDGQIDEGTAVFDDDGDGYCESTSSPCVGGALPGDCDDTDAAIHPGASEQANGRDDNCDGVIDEGTERYDDDGDSFTELGGDCDDTRPDVNPAQVEVRGNGRDDDCDPTTAD